MTDKEKLIRENPTENEKYLLGMLEALRQSVDTMFQGRIMDKERIVQAKRILSKW